MRPDAERRSTRSGHSSRVRPHRRSSARSRSRRPDRDRSPARASRAPATAPRPMTTGPRSASAPRRIPGTAFSGWSGDCTGSGSCDLTLNGDRSVGAIFASPPPPPVQRTLTVSATGPGSVTGPGIACPGDCTQTYDDGTQVSLSAAPDSGDSFSGWSGDCSGSGSCNLTLNGDRSVGANFASPPPRRSSARSRSRRPDRARSPARASRAPATAPRPMTTGPRSASAPCRIPGPASPAGRETARGRIMQPDAERRSIGRGTLRESAPTHVHPQPRGVDRARLHHCILRLEHRSQPPQGTGAPSTASRPPA